MDGAQGPPAAAELARIQREDSTRLVAALVRRFGDIDLAEDIAQEAMAAALETWPTTGVPRTPLAWLMTTAKRKAIDAVRRDATLARRLAELRVEESVRAPATQGLLPDAEIPDERLELFFGCCHPSLRLDEQIALTLRFLGGLSTAEVAAAFLVPIPTMQARLTRAKRRIRVNRIPMTVPEPEAMGERLPAVLHVVYLIFTEGYAATSGEDHLRPDLTGEAIRLARILAGFLPESSEVLGLLALLLLTETRSAARVDGDRLPVPLEHQDRAHWDTALRAEGLALAERAAALGGGSQAGPYAIQGAIAAVHAEAPTFAESDWEQIAVLYRMLAAVQPGPVVALSRAVALGRRDGPETGLRLLDDLSDEPALQRHHPYHSARAVTLELLDRTDEAARAWRAAIEVADSAAERAYLERRLDALTGRGRTE